MLLGVLGGYFLFAAAGPEHRPVAYLVGFVMVTSFLLLAATIGGYNQQIARVYVADGVALGALLIGALVRVLR